MENFLLAIPKNDRDAKAGGLTILLAVTDHDIVIEGMPFTWTKIVHIDGGCGFSPNAIGHESVILTETFNNRYQFI